MKAAANPNSIRMEKLEQRELLSSAVLNSSGVLKIQGRLVQADDISATVLSDGTVSVAINGSSPTGSPFSGVTAIKIYGLGGADNIVLDESNAPGPIPAQISGGAGDDSILTIGNEPTFINGGGGADSIEAGNGNNVVRGGGGADNISVGNGSNIVLGGPGSNTISGGTGSDTLVGDDSPDSISGGGGSDLIWGVAGNDTLSGDFGGLSGMDTIYGGTGSANQITPGPSDKVNPKGRVHPKNASTFLTNLEGLTAVP